MVPVTDGVELGPPGPGPAARATGAGAALGKPSLTVGGGTVETQACQRPAAASEVSAMPRRRDNRCGHVNQAVLSHG